MPAMHSEKNEEMFKYYSWYLIENIMAINKQYGTERKMLIRFSQILCLKAGRLKSFDTFANRWRSIFKHEICVMNIGVQDVIEIICREFNADAISSHQIVLFDDFCFNDRRKCKRQSCIFPKIIRMKDISKYAEWMGGENPFNYYIADIDLQWAITICHEGDIHLSGPLKILRNITQKLPACAIIENL